MKKKLRIRIWKPLKHDYERTYRAAEVCLVLAFVIVLAFVVTSLFTLIEITL